MSEPLAGLSEEEVELLLALRAERALYADVQRAAAFTLEALGGQATSLELYESLGRAWTRGQINRGLHRDPATFERVPAAGRRPALWRLRG